MKILERYLTSVNRFQVMESSLSRLTSFIVKLLSVLKNMHSVSILNVSSFNFQLLDLIMSLFHRQITPAACLWCSHCAWGSSEPSLPLPIHILRHEHQSDHVLQGSLFLTPATATCKGKRRLHQTRVQPALCDGEAAEGASCFCVTAELLLCHSSGHDCRHGTPLSLSCCLSSHAST